MSMSKSTEAAIVEKLVTLGTLPRSAIITEALLEYKKYKGNVKKYSAPLFMKLFRSLKEDHLDQMQVFQLNQEDSSDYTIIYLHGGAYVNEMMAFHWAMLENISNLFKSYILIPDYPLAPRHNYKEAYDDLTKLYSQYIQEHPDKKVILMGDSAGAGLAIGLAQYWHKNNIAQPHKIIALSPWLDLSMENEEIKDYQPLDPMLKVEKLKIDAQYWANGTDLKDPMLSPMYGDLTGLKDITLFVGTHEIFYPDITKFYKKLQENNITSRLFIGEGLNHVYPAFPIPEAKVALQQIVDIIQQ